MSRATDLFGRALDLIRFRKRAYKLVFGAPGYEVVIKDLARFCRGHETTFHPDARVQAMLEGRRQVLLRIEQHLGYSSEELVVLYKVPIPQQAIGDEDA